MTKRMRVCYIAKSKVPSPEANSIQVMKMSAALAECGAQTELVVPFRPSDWWRARRQTDLWAWYAVPRSFRITRVPYLYPGQALNRRSGGLAYGLAAALYVALRNPDLAYTRHPWAAYWLARWGRPVVYEAHHPAQGMAHPAFGRLLPLMTRSTSLRGIVAISQGAADAYVAAGVPAKRINVLHDGVDVERFRAVPAKQDARKQLGLPAQRKIVTHVGHLYPGRGAELLLECAAQLPELLFVFVGGLPHDIARCQALDPHLGNVHYVGLVPNPLVPTYLAASDVVVMPYTSSTPTVNSMSPLKMFEYMASGIPTVASDFATIREVLTDQRNALLVEPDRADTLRQGIERVLCDPSLARELGQAARADVQRYTWSSRARRILDLFCGSPSTDGPIG